MSKRKPRSPGVILRGRAAGPHRYDDEINTDGGKAKLHRQVRRAERHALRLQIRDETGTE
ncbi:hypothetical protein [Streptomyces asiaticus]|uniref:hypothetical protein n=1 Tax=Streptomyces asiaticus TaxID=114695 RepID=UPI003816492D